MPISHYPYYHYYSDAEDAEYEDMAMLTPPSSDDEDEDDEPRSPTPPTTYAREYPEWTEVRRRRPQPEYRDITTTPTIAEVTGTPPLLMSWLDNPSLWRVHVPVAPTISYIDLTADPVTVTVATPTPHTPEPDSTPVTRCLFDSNEDDYTYTSLP